MAATIPDLVRHTGSAYESIRASNHITIGAMLPAPTIYDTLGELKALSNALPQLLKQLGAGLGRSFDQLEVFEDDGADPHERATEAMRLLLDAADLADQLGTKLDQAQGKLSRQAYKSAIDFSGRDQDDSEG